MNKLNMDHWKTGSAREAQIERDYDAEQYFKVTTSDGPLTTTDDVALYVVTTNMKAGATVVVTFPNGVAVKIEPHITGPNVGTERNNQ